MAYQSIPAGGASGGSLTDYFALAGRAGGQSGSGGTGSAENLALYSTTHPTRGLVYIGGSGAAGGDNGGGHSFDDRSSGVGVQIYGGQAGASGVATALVLRHRSSSSFTNDIRVEFMPAQGAGNLPAPGSGYAALRASVASGINSSVYVETRTAGAAYARHTTFDVAGNLALGAGTPTYGGGTGVIYVANAPVVPTSNPTGGALWFVEGTASKALGGSGTAHTFGPADPHCPTCGADFMTEYENPKYGYLALCLKCLADFLGERPWILRAKAA